MDSKKVYKGLECHRIDDNHRINCADCPYYVDDDNHIRCVNDLHDDAIELLKEQESKTGYWNGPECSCCHAILERTPRFFRYCPYCGAKMDNTEGR